MGERTVDKTAVAKTFWLFLVSIIFIVTYGSAIKICDEGVDEENISDSTCRMNLYGGDKDGDVKTWYYILIWSGVAAWSFIGFALLVCNCNMLIRRGCMEFHRIRAPCL